MLFRNARYRNFLPLAALLVVLGAFVPTLRGQDIPPRPDREPVDVAVGTQGVVVTDTTVSTDVGHDILAKGGNAVDAAVAVAFALEVSWPEAGNIGGGGFMMIAPPNEDVVCVNYREKAPAAVNEYSFDKWTDDFHVRMAGVPGTVRGLALAHEKYGKLPWKDVVQPAVELARDGIEVDGYLAYSLNKHLNLEYMKNKPQYAEFRKVYGNPDGYFWKAGDKLVQPELAETLSLIAEQGPSAFYEGKIAQQIVAEMKRSGGLITAEDLKNYTAKIQPTIAGQIGPYTVHGASPPSSGGITVLIQLQILEALDFPKNQSAYWTADQVHLMTEAMRRAFRERAAWLGDPDYVEIPEKLTTKAYAAELAKTVQMDKATPSADVAGDIPLAEGPYESPETLHFSVIDKDGLAVSNTYTLENTYGCRMVVQGAGFLLNNEMGDFNWYPGYTDDKGRIGTKPNLLAPGKRMLSSQSPTIVRENGKAKLLIGSPGGRTIINTVSEILVQTLMLDRSLEEAIDGPRFHHQWFPDQLRVESTNEKLLNPIKADLKARGHKVVTVGRQGSAHGIIVDTKTGEAKGVADWRRGGASRAVK